MDPGRPCTPMFVIVSFVAASMTEGDADPQAPGGMAAIYRDLTVDDSRTRQITADVAAALHRGRHCLVLTQWVAHLQALAAALQATGHEPVVLRGGMTARARAAALARPQPRPGGPPLLVVATGPTPTRALTARPWTPRSSPPRSGGKDAWSSTQDGSCAPTQARTPPRSTTITTPRLVSSPRPWPAARGYTGLGFPDAAGSRRPRARPVARSRQPGDAMSRKPLYELRHRTL